MALPEYEPEDVTGSTLHVLRTVLSNFSLSPLKSGKRVRDLLLSDYFNFREAALTVLREPMDVRGLRYLVTLLWTNDMLISILGDVTLPKELSIAISQVATKVDTQFHIRLIRFLVTGMLEGREIEEKSANRLLEVLGSISDGATIQGFLRQMLRHPNLRIRSKITLLVGNGGKASSAIRKVLSDVEEDPRVRANALEALWSNHDPEIVELFRDMLEDPNNRVAGNAALGVYFSGDPLSIPVIRKMATHPETPFRQTAAWVMGRTEDPRFLPDVGRLMGQPNASLRKAVFHAVGAIKGAAARRAKNPPLLLGLTEAAQTGSGKTYIRLVLASGSAELEPIAPTGFAVFADNKPVPQFSCMERRNAHISAAFLLPRKPEPSDPLRLILRDALSECLEKKRAADRWLIVRYQEAAVSGSATEFRMFGQTVIAEHDLVRPSEKKVPLTLTAHAPTLLYELESNSPRSDNIPDVFQGISRVVNSLRVVRSARFVLALVDTEQEMDNEGFDALAKIVRTSGVVVSAVSTVRIAQVEQLCRESSGVFHMVPDIDAVGPAVKTLYQSFQSEYFLEFVCSSPIISIQVYNACLFGEAALNLSRDSDDSVELPLEVVDSRA